MEIQRKQREARHVKMKAEMERSSQNQGMPGVANRTGNRGTGMVPFSLTASGKNQLGWQLDARPIQLLRVNCCCFKPPSL